MGYRCPNCNKDFGTDKDSFKQHLYDNPKCGAESATILHLLPIALGIKEPKKHNITLNEENENHRKKHCIDYISEDHVWVKLNIVSNDDGSDTIVCEKCGLIAKRFGSSLKFDMRYTRKIKYCINDYGQNN